MAVFNIRDVPDLLAEAVHRAAEAKGVSLRAWVIRACEEALVQSPDVLAVADRRSLRRHKKELRHQQLHADSLAALPDQLPARMREKMNSQPVGHHQRCPCLRCQAFREAPPSKVRALLTAGK